MSATVRFSGFDLDLARRELRKDGLPVELQPKVFAVLVLLVSHAGRALSTDDFLELVWSGRFVTQNVLSRCIRALRRVFNDNAAHPTFIRTVRGHGYEFIAPLEITGGRDDSTANEIRIVAVVPFRPLLPTSSHPSLEMGLAETLISDLSRLPDLTVRPLGTVLNAAGTLPVSDPIALARRLKADVVVDGSLQLSQEHVRLSVRAIRVQDETAMLSERFDESLEDLFSVQDRLCLKVTESLALRLSEHAGATVPQRSTQSVGAYRAYVDGRLKLAHHESQSSNEALALFTEALSLDPAYAEAMVGVAEAHDFLGTLGSDSATHFKAMRKYAERALEVNAKMARAHACLAKVAWQYEWDWSRAERLFNDARALDPADAEVLVSYSDFLAFRRRYDEALEVAERAGEINPFSPWIQALIAQALYMGGRYGDAVEQSRRAIELAPSMSFNQLYLGLALLQLDQSEEAVRQLELAFNQSGRSDLLGPLGYALGRNGQRDEASALMAKLKQQKAAGTPVPPIAFAIILMGLGDSDAALQQLQETANQRSWHILLLHADPLFKELRARPESLALLQRCGVC